MEYIVWKDSFNVGVKEMDHQHRLFAGYINELYDAIKSGNSESIVVPILDKLTGYSKIHFAAEEKLLKSNNYPMLEIQIQQHKHFISELSSLKSSYMNKTQTAQNMLLCVKDWLLHHIMTEDLKYAEYI